MYNSSRFLRKEGYTLTEVDKLFHSNYDKIYACVTNLRSESIGPERDSTFFN